MKINKFFKTAISTLVVASFLTSCQSKPSEINSLVNTVQTSSNSVKKVNSKTFFPTEKGFTWKYNVVFHPESDPLVDYKGTYTVSVDEVTEKGNTTELILKSIDTATSRYIFPKIIMNKNSISIQDVDYFGFGASKVSGLNIDFLELPLKANMKIDDGEWISEVKGKELIDTPDGKYDTWKISVIGTHDRRYTAVGNYWVTPGIGIIKSELSVPGWSLESELISSGLK